jgi:FkbM family methyltransferase
MRALLSNMLGRLSYLSRRLDALRGRLPTGRLFRLAAARGMLRWLDPDLIPSYAQFGEDRLIDRFFGTREHGVYVDVGCNRPISYSNTWKLYLRGWHGIAIDANPTVLAEYARVRRNDIALNEVISMSTTPVDFYIPHHSHLIAGIGEQTAGPWQRTTSNSKVVTYYPVRLGSLLERYGVESCFDFLSIDTEGHELDVLQSLDLAQFTPTLIAVEIHDFEIKDPDKSAVYALLVNHDYRIMAYLPPTVFFAWRNSNG